MSDGDGAGEPTRRRAPSRLISGLVLCGLLGVLVAVRVTADPDPGVAARATTRAATGRDGSATTAGGEPTTSRATGPAATIGVELADDAAAAPKPGVLAGLHFTDATAQAGLDALPTPTALTADRAMSSGAAVADVDRDGDLDLFLTRVGHPDLLYRNDGDATFTDVTAAAGLAAPRTAEQGSAAAAFGDVDGDGCVDLYTGGAGTGVAVLHRNDCHGRFVDETASRGLALPPTTSPLGAQGHGAVFGDYDHDGHLDLLVLEWDTAVIEGDSATAADAALDPERSTCDRMAAIRARGASRSERHGPNRSRLFHNDGTGHLVDATARMGLRLDGIVAFTGDFVDMDGDGWEDLVIAGDFCTSALFRNDGGRRFVDVTRQAGVGTDENGMGSVVRDVDGDGLPDWFVTSIRARSATNDCVRTGVTGCSGNRLYRNVGGGRFEDTTDRSGVRHGWWGWGAAVADFANDGRLEIVQTNGYVSNDASNAAYRNDPMRFWVPDGERHVEAAASVGMASRAVGHALVAFDYDGDGDLDVLVSNLDAAPTLYRNEAPRSNHHLDVRLDDPRHPGNRAGLGARVVVTRHDGVRVTQWVSTGGSYESSNPAQVHVGLATDSSPVRVEVWWPGESRPQVLDEVAVDRTVVVTRR